MATGKKAFVLMPFAPQYDSYYLRIFKPALEAALYEVSRGDDLFTPGFIIADVQKSILEAHLILCDMSERNPNVFYELGLAHAIGRPVILIVHKKEDIPFDLRHLRVTIYDSNVPEWEEKLRQSITQAARAVDDSYKVYPPPLIKSENVVDDKKILPSAVEVTLKQSGSAFLFDNSLFIRVTNISRTVDFIVGYVGHKNESCIGATIGDNFIYEHGGKYDIRLSSIERFAFGAKFIVTKLEN